MIQVRNNAILTTALAVTADGATVPFDTTVINTNSNLALSNNTIQELVIGIYDTECTVVLQNADSASVTVTLAAYADGSAITGASIQTTIPAAGIATLTIPWTVKVQEANSGIAATSWFISGGAVNLINAFAQVFKHF